MSHPILALVPLANSPNAAADLVNRALEAPDLFVFSEVLRSQTVISQLASTPSTQSYIDLLRIFSSGSLSDYKGMTAILKSLRKHRWRC